MKRANAEVARPLCTTGFRVAEAQRRLGNIGRSTLNRWIAEGRIKAVKIGGAVIIPETEVDRVLTPAD